MHGRYLQCSQRNIAQTEINILLSRPADVFAGAEAMLCAAYRVAG